MNITDYLVEKSDGLLQIIPEPLNYGNSYSAFNDASPEVEVCEFLYSFVRILKPQSILETGTCFGISGAYLAQGCKDNGFGKVTTIEYNPDLIKKSEELWKKLELTAIEGKQGLSLQFNPTENYDIFLSDTEVDIRLHELVKFYPNLNPGGFVFIHDMPYDLAQNTHNPDHPDTDPWPIGPIPKEITNWVKNGELRPVFFPNPRGMCLFYKPKPNEYKWL